MTSRVDGRTREMREQRKRERDDDREQIIGREAR